MLAFIFWSLVIYKENMSQTTSHPDKKVLQNKKQITNQSKLSNLSSAKPQEL